MSTLGPDDSGELYSIIPSGAPIGLEKLLDRAPRALKVSRRVDGMNMKETHPIDVR